MKYQVIYHETDLEPVVSRPFDSYVDAYRHAREEATFTTGHPIPIPCEDEERFPVFLTAGFRSINPYTGYVYAVVRIETDAPTKDTTSLMDSQ